MTTTRFLHRLVPFAAVLALCAVAGCAAEASSDAAGESGSALSACPLVAEDLAFDDASGDATSGGATSGLTVASLHPMADPPPDLPPKDQRVHADPRNKHVGSNNPQRDSGTAKDPVGQYNKEFNYKNGKLAALEDEALEKGKEVKCGAKKNTRYFDYTNPGGNVGYSGGKPTDRIRVEITGKDVHSYPMPK